jgi:hypothetical protein
VAFISVFTFVAMNIVASKYNFAVASSLLPVAIASGDHAARPDNTSRNTTNDSTKTDKNSSAPTTASKTSLNTANQPASSQIAPAPKPAAAPALPAQPAPAPIASPAGTWTYPLHSGIRTTWFYAGEPASADNDFIQNVSSAWQENWQAYYGGSDDPSSRCSFYPCGFTPRENPFYFALPFSDFTNTGPVADLSMVYWYTPASRTQLNNDQSILKNRWIQITLGGKTSYAQWEDVGPFNEHDGNYVFGSAGPQSSRAGLDVSPAVRDYLGMGGSANTSWRFVDASEVPAGPWKPIITTSGPDWN